MALADLFRTGMEEGGIMYLRMCAPQEQLVGAAALPTTAFPTASVSVAMATTSLLSKAVQARIGALLASSIALVWRSSYLNFPQNIIVRFNTIFRSRLRYSV
jgi:hypothetical protein